MPHRRTPAAASEPPTSGPAAVNGNLVPDATLPTLARQEELRAAVSANRQGGLPPYAGVRIATRGELEWIMAVEEHWSGEHDAYAVKYHLSRLADQPRSADLRQVNLSYVALGDIWLRLADLREANLVYAGLQGAHLADARLDGADLGHCDLASAELSFADLSQAHLREAGLSNAVLEYAALSGARLHKADLRGATLRGARMDSSTVLSEVRLDGATRLGDIIWSSAALTRVDWSKAKRLGDEKAISAARWDRAKRLDAEEGAVRAYRQLSLALQAQGLADAAAHYAYQGQVLHRRVLRRRGRLGRWLFSWLLALLAGYGYRLGRILVAYLLVVFACAVAYFALGHHGYGPQLAPQEAFLASVTAFHGRVFSERFDLATPQAWVAAGEAIVGMVIEGVFIAMLVQRVFVGK